MSGEQYEIEIKSLLGSSLAADALRERMKAMDSDCVCRTTSAQLNHYFQGGDPKVLAERLAKHLSSESAEKLKLIADRGTKISVRTREENGEARIVMKASIGSDSSENGVMRAELEAPVADFSMEQLDSEVLAAGFNYQAKWSRSREEYSLKDVTVCLDKNAGYGYLAEFEKVIQDAERAEDARADILDLMDELGIVELPQDRLERMFAFYNEHWPEYYGTDKIFTLD